MRALRTLRRHVRSRCELPLATTNADHGTNRSISFRNSRLRERLFVHCSPRLVCDMAVIVPMPRLQRQSTCPGVLMRVP